MNRSIHIHQMIMRSSFCLFAWCTLAVVPTFAQTITHVPLFTFDGDAPFDFFGWSVSGAGDVNGDGFADLIVGAWGDDNNGEASGSARVFSGSDGSVLYNFDGDSAGDSLGLSVSGAGDVNGDGFADLIVGAPSDDNNGEASGSVRVLSGFDGSVLYNFNGDSASTGLGSSVSGAGDVNGDGFADLIAGAEGDDTNGPDSGIARVFSGSDGSVLYNFNVVDSSNTRFGFSVSGAGDVNGDGVPDLIVGAPDAGNDGEFRGGARVFSGSDGSLLYDFDSGSTSIDGFGFSVSGAGDVNGDGVADFVVGAPVGGANDGGFARVFVSVSLSSVPPAALLGDSNQDGVVDFFDILAFIEVLQSGIFLLEADCNQDGAVNFEDIPAFIEILQVQ